MTKFSLRNTFLTTNVLVLGIVSLLADLSTEMIQPILPLFLVGVLGTSYTIVGLVEGSSDATTSIVKVISGCIRSFLQKKTLCSSGLSPYRCSKTTLVFCSNPIAGDCNPCSDRVGKGMGPRDALIAESVERKFG